MGRGHQSRVEALHHALGGHIVEMDDSVPCGIRLDGELICSGLEYALIRPEVVDWRPDTYRPRRSPYYEPLCYPCDAGEGWIERMAVADVIYAPCGVTALEACCLGVPLMTWVASPDQQPLYDAIRPMSDDRRFRVIDGLGAYRVAGAIKLRLGALTVFDEELDPPFRV